MYFDTAPILIFIRKSQIFFYNFLKVFTGKFEVIVTVSSMLKK